MTFIFSLECKGINEFRKKQGEAGGNINIILLK